MAECRNNCFTGCTISTFDKCIRYTGDDVEELDICNGEKLDTIIEKIIDNLGGYATGEGITITLPTPCTYIADKLSADYSLSNILSAFSEAICEINDSVIDIEAIIAAQYSFNTSCLTITATSPTRDDILQATINQTCSNTTSITTILGDYVKATELNTLIQQYLDSIAEDPNAVVQQNTKMVPFVAYEYYGPLSNFDSSGKGLTANGYTKVYICNGSNGTPDKRGRVAVGVNLGVPGSTMDSAVDPSIPGNYQISLKNKLGEFKHITTVAEAPAHTHIATASEHFHYLFSNVKAEGGPVTSTQFSIRESGDANSAYSIKGNTQYTPSVGKSNSVSTSVSIASSGGSTAHNNTQPSIGANFIMFIP